jgi:uncharacterized protein with PIN domain
MGLNQLIRNPWLSRILLIVSIVSTAAILLLYSRIDSLVNVSLYNYKLQFNSNWYNPYQSTTQLINVCLGAVLALNAVALGLSLIGKPRKVSENSASIQHNSSLNIQDARQQDFTLAEKINDKPAIANTSTCVNCNKTFTRPLVTLNFVNGKPKMMNTCPYCNAPIENANNDKNSDTSTQIADEEKEKSSKSRYRKGN